MGIGAAASLIVFGIFLYLAIYLRYIAGIRLEWSVYAPNAIPAATVAGLIAFLRSVGIAGIYGSSSWAMGLHHDGHATSILHIQHASTAASSLACGPPFGC